MSIKLNLQNAGLRDHELDYVRPLAETASMLLTERTGQGAEMLGWLDLPHTYDQEEFARIKTAAKRIQAQSQVLVAIGIGGSYLGARAGLEFVKGPFGNQLPQEGGVEVSCLDREGNSLRCYLPMGVLPEKYILMFGDCS